MHSWYRMCDVCIEWGMTCSRLLCIDDITCVMCALKEAWHVADCYALMISHAWCVHWKRRDMLPVVMHWWYHMRDVRIERGVTCYRFVMHWWYHMRDVCIQRGVTCCRLLCIDDITCVMCALKEAWHFAGHDKILDCRVCRALLAPRVPGRVCAFHFVHFCTESVCQTWWITLLPVFVLL